MRARSIASLVLFASTGLVSACGPSTDRPDAFRVRTDADHANIDVYVPPFGNCTEGNDCTELHDYTMEELELAAIRCEVRDAGGTGVWTWRELCDQENVVGGCRADDPDGVGYAIQWLREPAYTTSGARAFCSAAGLPFEPPR
jgi:hypothetical protein